VEKISISQYRSADGHDERSPSVHRKFYEHRLLWGGSQLTIYWNDLEVTS